MKILLIGYGSRGDVQPLIALALGLKSAGYTVALGAGTNFRQMITDAGVDYQPINVDIQAIMNSEIGKTWTGKASGSLLEEGKTMKRMVNEYGVALADDLMRISEGFDVLVSGVLTFNITHMIARMMGKKHLTIRFAPFNVTSAPHACIAPAMPFTNPLNRMSGIIGLYYIYWVVNEMTNAYFQKLGHPPIHFKETRHLLTYEVPTVYGISPAVMPKPHDWNDKQAVTGYWFQAADEDWTPPAALVDFLAAGEAPVYVGFGSMSHDDPQSTLEMILAAFEKTGQRGVVSAGWAGLKADAVPSNLFMLDSAPHDWLFPQMRAVIHHGGAGTTAAAFQAGVPQTVVSHIADQPYWGKRAADLGVATPYIRRSKLSVARLVQAITHLTTDRQMQAKAAAFGAVIRQEDGVEAAVAYFRRMLGA